MSKISSSLKVFFYSLCLLSVTNISSFAQFKVVGYLVNWSGFVSGANAVDYTKVTHINVAFINPINNSGAVGPLTDLNTVSTIVHNNNRKILASIGGADASKPYWSAAMATPTSRANFIQNLMQMVADNNLDGIDVDIEGDLLDNVTITSAQYASFVQDLQTALHGQGKLMTAALGIWFGHLISNTTAQRFDWINAMAYDEYGTWTGPGQHSSYALAVRDLDYWNGKGVDKDHLVLGVPSYGYRWNGNASNGSITYRNLVTQYPRAANQDSIIPAANQSIYYNGIPTIKDKTALAITDASGIMMWTLQNDFPTTNPNSLIRAIDEVVQATLNNTLPVVSITSPANGSTYTEGDTITISADAMDSDGTIESVTFHGTVNTITQTIGEDQTAPYSIDWRGAGPGVYTLHAKARDNAYGIGTSSNITVTINTPSEARPFGGPYAIPGKIEAENFDIGKGLGYHDLDEANQGGAYRTTSVDIEANGDSGGGYNVGWIQPGEWLSYTVNVAATGTYNLQVRVASTMANRYFHIEMNGTNVSGNITIPNTSSWTNFQTVTIPNVPLTAGVQAMRFVFDTGDFNLNFVNFTSTVTSISDADASGTISAVVSPNPFSQDAQLSFSLKNGGQTKIVLSNMIGSAPVTLADHYMAPGEHKIDLHSAHLPSGIYLCTITNGGHTKAVKVVKE